MERGERERGSDRGLQSAATSLACVHVGVKMWNLWRMQFIKSDCFSMSIFIHHIVL